MPNEAVGFILRGKKEKGVEVYKECSYGGYETERVFGGGL